MYLRNYTKDIISLNTELGHPSEEITLLTKKEMGLQFTGTIRKNDGPFSKGIEGKLLINISSPSSACVDGKKHLFLVVNDSPAYACFLKEKSELKDVMIITSCFIYSCS